MSKPRIMFLVPADYCALRKKGVEDLILERDEDGFFERVVTVHPLGLESIEKELNPVHVLYEIRVKARSTNGLKRKLLISALPIFFIKLIVKIIKIARMEKVTLIRANDPYWIGLIGYLVSRITGLPFCVSIHADYDQRYKVHGPGNPYTFLGFRFPMVLLSRFVFKRANMILPIRDSLGKWAAALGANPKKIRVIPHGVDFSKYSEIDDNCEWLPSSVRKKRIIGFVGRLSKENYVHQFPEIIETLLTKRDDFVFVLAGDGELFEYLREKTKENPILGDHLLLLGFQSSEACYLLQRCSDVCVCLMGGFSLIEACAAARPVIAYDVEWHYELVVNKRTGFLLPENDTNAVVQAIDSILEDRDAATEMGKNAAALVRERHDIQVTSRIKRECYSEILKKNQGEVPP